MEVLVGAAVEVIGAALGDDSDLTADGAAVLCGVVGCEDLDLFDGVEVGCADGVATGADADGDGAVVGEEVVALTGSVDVDGAEAGAEV